MLHNLADAVVQVDAAGKIIFVNDRAQALFGHGRDALVGSPIEMLIPGRFRESHVAERSGHHGAPRERKLGTGPPLYALRKDGSEFPAEIGLSPVVTARGVVVTAVICDVTERKQYEAQLRYLAEHDPLTGLLNRRRFEQELVRQLAYSARYGTSGAVMVLDLDGFKSVNDTLGHKVGDEVLKSVAVALRGRLRKTDLIARLGGDEFVVLLPQVDEERARTVARDLLDAVRASTVSSGGQMVRVTGCMGIGLFDGREPCEEVLSAADTALYEAKAGQGGSFVVRRASTRPAA